MNHNSFPTGEQAPSQQDSGDAVEFPSFEEHMQQVEQQSKITPEAKDRIVQAAIYRDEASRRRLDFAANKNLSLEEQDKILNKEIAIETADKELLEDLASDNGTVSSMEKKLKNSVDAVNNATKDL